MAESDALLDKILVADQGYNCTYSIFARVIQETPQRLTLQMLKKRWADPIPPTGRQEGNEVPNIDGIAEVYEYDRETAVKTPDDKEYVCRSGKGRGKVYWSVWDSVPRYCNND